MVVATNESNTLALIDADLKGIGPISVVNQDGPASSTQFVITSLTPVQLVGSEPFPESCSESGTYCFANFTIPAVSRQQLSSEMLRQAVEKQMGFNSEHLLWRTEVVVEQVEQSEELLGRYRVYIDYEAYARLPVAKEIDDKINKIKTKDYQLLVEDPGRISCLVYGPSKYSYSAVITLQEAQVPLHILEIQGTVERAIGCELISCQDLKNVTEPQIRITLNYDKYKEAQSRAVCGQIILSILLAPFKLLLAPFKFALDLICKLISRMTSKKHADSSADQGVRLETARPQRHRSDSIFSRKLEKRDRLCVDASTAQSPAL